MTPTEIIYRRRVRVLEHAAQRVARAAALSAIVGGRVTEAAADDCLFGFCHWAGLPGDLVALDSF